MILGIDEVGRGPWAGPLVVGAVVLGDMKIDGLTDSKKLSKLKRKKLSAKIYETADGVGLGWVSAKEIDELGLSEALRLATRRAVRQIHAPFHEIIIDGTVNFLAGTPLEQYVSTMKKADLLIASVSAASIIAKVARDTFMEEQGMQFPGYGFENHVGYGTAEHKKALDKLGPTPLHRMSFAPLASKAPKKHAQLSPDTTRAVGNASETAAAEELVRRGHRVIERNWKTKYCEIDIVSEKDSVVYFAEVKHRRNAKNGDGIAAITPKKLNQMKFAARLYAQVKKLADTDLGLIVIGTCGDTPSIERVVEIEG